MLYIQPFDKEMLIDLFKVTHKNLLTQNHYLDLVTPLPVLGEVSSLLLYISPRTFYWEIIRVRKIWWIPGQKAAEVWRLMPGPHYTGIHAGTDTALFKIHSISDFSPRWISYHLFKDALTFVSLKIISSDIWEKVWLINDRAMSRVGLKFSGIP